MKNFKRLIPHRKKRETSLGDRSIESEPGIRGRSPRSSERNMSKQRRVFRSNDNFVSHEELEPVEYLRGHIFVSKDSGGCSLDSYSDDFHDKSVSDDMFHLKLEDSFIREQESTSYAEESLSLQLNGIKRSSLLGSGITLSNKAPIPEDSFALHSYAQVPVLEQTKLPRGGVSMDTQAVGRIQFGIPPETIKDSMRLGLSVPAVYIVPVERFCREMGPALGVNLAEFEFPAYFNFFVFKKRCTLVVDSEDAEQNIRRVFSETLLGPAQFRREQDPLTHEEEDFAPNFPREAIPNFQKEFEYFRIMPDGKELVLETLLNFRHFESPGDSGIHENLGVPPPFDPSQDTNRADEDEITEDIDVPLNIVENPKASQDTEDHDPNGEEIGENTTKKVRGVNSWKYSHSRWIGEVATLWPHDATEEQISTRTCKRVELFKMPGGTEYILHDIDENNFIVGKARFSGNVKVSESMSVDGFGGKSMLDIDTEDENDDLQEHDSADSECSTNFDRLLDKKILPPTFHPPSFGVTILGNSHGFDKSGSTSGYVLWINGRGVMIDPPPYSSATLEREGIRPRTIVGIIVTHCHADHDAGAFQKVLTGSPVVVITTPTIYKSFIRKYAALSALSPALLRHSHRHKPAIIGTPLRFQGATFHFTYTLHTIPCIGFRVEWRGRSMVFTGDHFNYPPAIDKLQESGVLSKARADDLRNLPLQEADLLLHEAGAPPIHTPLDVLMKLPEKVKKRMYVVHTSALPEGCDLRVAPTGTAGTIRLDRMRKVPIPGEPNFRFTNKRSSRSIGEDDIADYDGNIEFHSTWATVSNEYGAVNEDLALDGNSSDPRLLSSTAANLEMDAGNEKQTSRRSNSFRRTGNLPPLVSLRPSSSTDAWFILNLLSAVPFLTSLSYASTMEVLETARVDAYCKDEIIVSTSRRNHVLCVVWEGTCVEKYQHSPVKDQMERSSPSLVQSASDVEQISLGVWHAGDWTGPIALQPDKRLSGESTNANTHDIVAMSMEGVKVISIEFSSLHAILKSGSMLYRKYLQRRYLQRRVTLERESEKGSKAGSDLLKEAIRNLNVLELLNCNSALRKLSAVQKRHLESLAEGPIYFQPGERLWRAGAPVENAFVVVSGTASFVPRRRNAGSVGLPGLTKSVAQRRSSPRSSSGDALELSLGDTMQRDALAAVRELRFPDAESHMEDYSESNEQSDLSSSKYFLLDSIFARPGNNGNGSIPSSLSDAHDYAKLSRGLQKRADLLSKKETAGTNIALSHDSTAETDDDSTQNIDLAYLDLDGESSGRSIDSSDRRLSVARRRSSRARFANKVLGRLYSRRAFTGGLVFSRGHFLGDVSKMVAGLLSVDLNNDLFPLTTDADEPTYGFGEKAEGSMDQSQFQNLETVNEINEQDDNEVAVVHSSTLTAGKEGCVVLVFMKSSLIPFLDEYPGLLLSLLGTQVVV